MAEPVLDADTRALLAEARRAVLTTIDSRDGRPRSVPICYALVGDEMWSALDEKPKSTDDPTALRRVRNLAVDPRATIFVDRWSEDWPKLAFVELATRGELVWPDDPTHHEAVEALRARYPQYKAHRLEDRPMLRFTPVSAVRWGDVRRALPGA